MPTLTANENIPEHRNFIIKNYVKLERMIFEWFQVEVFWPNGVILPAATANSAKSKRDRSISRHSLTI